MIKVTYTTADGKVFDSKEDAEQHEQTFTDNAKVKYERYLGSHTAISLLEKYNLTEYGIWSIYGEDPNCDFRGPHHTPYLQTVEGSLEDCIKHAVKLKGFFTWGSGGYITKVEVLKL